MLPSFAKISQKLNYACESWWDIYVFFGNASVVFFLNAFWKRDMIPKWNSLFTGWFDRVKQTQVMTNGLSMRKKNLTTWPWHSNNFCVLVFVAAMIFLSHCKYCDFTFSHVITIYIPVTTRFTICFQFREHVPIFQSDHPVLNPLKCPTFAMNIFF